MDDFNQSSIRSGASVLRLRLFGALLAAVVVPLGIGLLVLRDRLRLDGGEALALAGVTTVVGAAVAAGLAAMLGREAPIPAAQRHDVVREFVWRFGEALRSTHDLGKMLSVVLETALVAVGGRAGAVWMLTGQRSELQAKVARGIDASARMALGEGIAGRVAETTESLLVPPAAPARAAAEPDDRAVLAVPLHSESHLIGVIAIYGSDRGVFSEQDLATIEALAEQAGIGVDNVLLLQETQRLSITDGLTGLWNRRYFQMSLTREIERAVRWQRPVSALMVDIDHFKRVNDEHGHQRGDEVLVELAHRVVSNTRHDIDIVARYGGEEFVLILPETGRDGARVVAEKILAAVGSVPFGSDDHPPLDITCSIGCATFPDDASTGQALVHAADQAMYLAKKRGRARVVGAEELQQAAGLARS